MGVTQPTTSRVRCRQIEETDLDAVLDLLVEGFPGQARAHWAEAMRQLAAHDTPAGYGKYGYLLECDGVVAGIVLLIFSKIDGAAHVRCSVSSWYVRPSFRGYAALLASHALSAPRGDLFQHDAGAAHAADPGGARLSALLRRRVRGGADLQWLGSRGPC